MLITRGISGSLQQNVKAWEKIILVFLPPARKSKDGLVPLGVFDSKGLM